MCLSHEMHRTDSLRSTDIAAQVWSHVASPSSQMRQPNPGKFGEKGVSHTHDLLYDSAPTTLLLGS